jgi:G3E family GTPase
VAQTFFVDPKLRARTRLDSITTLVDARHITARLADSREAVEQIAFADQILLNKTDLADEAALAALERQLRRINPLAPIYRTQHSGVPLAQVLGRGGFELDRIVALEPGFLQPAHVHDEHCTHEHHDHVHDSGIDSVSLTSPRPMDAASVERWLTELCATQGPNILRAKGIIDVAGDRRRLVFQAVHMILEGDWQRPWRDDEERRSRLVFIGRGLDAAALRAGFEACVATG